MVKPNGTKPLSASGDLMRSRLETNIEDTKPPATPTLAGVALVFLGGCAGTACRALLDQAFPNTPTTMPVTLWINLFGAFVLGFLLHAITRSQLHDTSAERLRLALGTGLLGGFTTYSAFALGVADLWLAGRVWAGVIYLALTVIVGGIATLIGVGLAKAFYESRQPVAPPKHR